MTNKELVSIILPTYNRAYVIHEAILSVLDQSYPFIELLVIDDGSEDDTEGAVRRFRDERIRYYRNPHRGVSHARNFGLGVATGEYIAFIDSDDVYKKDKIKSQVEYLRSDPRKMVAYSPYIVSIHGVEKLRRAYNGEGNLFLKIFKESFINMNSTLIRKECFNDVAGFDEKLKILEDYDFYLRLAEKFEFGYVDVVSSCYRLVVKDSQEVEDYVLYTGLIRDYYAKFDLLKQHPRVYRWKYAKALFGLGRAYYRKGEYGAVAAPMRQSLIFSPHVLPLLYIMKARLRLLAG
jgi:glycosyltransferase involved in cell wall biosynthesis